MVSLISTSLSDAFSFIFTARNSVNRIGFALLLSFFTITTSISQVLINEVVTDPQVDWSTNGFDGTDGLSTIDSDDDWIELYINANGLDLTGWTIEMNDGTDASGTIAASGAFITMNYISGTGGLFTDTDIGDYIVLGQPNSSTMDETVTIILRDDMSTIIDQVIIAAGSGTMFSGAATGLDDESVCRIPNGQDTDVETDDFVQTRATLGANNSPLGSVLINEVITDPQQDWQGVGFASTPGVTGGNNQGTDEWIELYIGTTGLNLTKWTIEANDGVPITGDLTARDVTGNGAFQEVVYSGTGSFTSTVAGDYLVLGNPQGAEAMNNTVTVTLTDPYGSTIDVVEIASGSGTGFDGNANDLDDESVCRIPNGQDTDVEATDFVQTRATIGANNSPTGTVLINEVVTSPQQDWSASGFTVAEPGGTAGSNDEWIELYIGNSGLNLIKWIISVQDGSDFSGDLTSSGAFSTVNYVGSGAFNNTVAGDYLILGNPTGSETINNDVYITLTDPYGTVIDDVEIGDDREGDGNGDGAADGSASGGLSSSIADESIFRVPLAQDTDDDVADFRKGLASLGTENGIIYVDASAPDDTGFGRAGDPKQLIQSGIDIAVEDGRVMVAAGTYTENLTISNPMTLQGANVGLDGNDSGRGAESIIEPATQSNALVIDADSVTIDGFQIGTSNADAAISSTGDSYMNIQYNVINADSVGIGLSTVTTGFINVTSNLINANDFTTGLGNLTSTLTLAGLVGDVDVNLSDNEHTGSALGIFVYACLSSNILSVANDTTTSSIRGISVFAYNGVAGASSSISVDGFSASGFAEPGGGITDFPEAGIYFYSAGANDNTHLITATVNNSSFAAVENTTSDYAGIICGDFSSTNYTEYLQDITVTACTFDSNENRGFMARGQNTRASISRSTFTNNGHDPTGPGGNYGFNLVVRNNAEVTASNSFFTSPSTQTTAGTDYEFRGLSLQAGSSLTITDSNFDNNGNPRGLYAATTGIDLSGNYFGTTVASDIDTLVNTNDFTPFLESGTDSDLGTAGFQGNFGALTVVSESILTTQTSGDRLQEGHDLLNASGTLTILQDDYVETLTVSKSLFLDPEASTTIDDMELNGGNVGVLADLEINNVLTLTNGILDIDLDDGDKSDDPTLTLNSDVSGTLGSNNHIEGKVEVAIGAAGTYVFPSGDGGSYRPVTLTPTNATTFSVAHVGATAPVGGGSFGDMRNLHGEVSAELGGTIQSTLTTRFWEIDVVTGTPGNTDVALQIAGSDEASEASTLGMLRFDGTNWLEMTHVSSTGTGPFVITGRTNSFSDFSIYSTNSSANPLPVELMDFSGRMENQDIRLKWATTSEVNADYFQVEHSSDGEHFLPIGSMDAQGNSSEVHNYDFVDMNVSSGVHYYRLNMVDFDGYNEYSSTIMIIPDLSDARIRVYPNPTTKYIRVDGIAPAYLKMLNIYDLNGRKLIKSTSSQMENIDVGDLPHGQYLLRLEMVDGSVFEGKLLKN